MQDDSENILSDFMSNKNREVLGEKTDTMEANNDNFLPDEVKIKKIFSGEASANNNDKAYVAARKALNMAITIPIFACALVSVFYLLLKFTPYILIIIRKLFISLA
jgi:hypothetical protein